MKRRLGMLLAALLLASVPHVASASKASASTADACFGQGSLQTGAPFYYPGFGWTTANFTLGFNVGTCLLTFSSFSVTGVMNGSCGLSVGYGEHSYNVGGFGWIEVGGAMVIVGTLSGTGHILPNALAGQSCTTGADMFLVELVLVSPVVR